MYPKRRQVSAGVFDQTSGEAYFTTPRPQQALAQRAEIMVLKFGRQSGCKVQAINQKIYKTPDFRGQNV